MITREEAQQVLDALETLAKYEHPEHKIQIRKQKNGGHIVTVYPHKLATNGAEILSARLSAPEPEPVGWMFDQAKYRENDLRGRQWAFNVFSQTKPYMDEMVRNVTPLYKDPTPCQTCEALARTVMMDQTSHDTTPPQRKEWIGLTEQEHANIAVEVGCASADWVFYGAAVERALKEKNT